MPSPPRVSGDRVPPRKLDGTDGPLPHPPRTGTTTLAEAFMSPIRHPVGQGRTSGRPRNTVGRPPHRAGWHPHPLDDVELDSVIALSRQSPTAGTVGGLAALALMAALGAAPAHATPPTGAQAVTLSKQTVNGKDYIVSEITLAPGGSTGWHWHRGEIYGVVKSGTLTHYAADCQQDGLYRAGDPILDPTGPDHVHLARNLGPVPVVLEVTYVDPVGAPTADGVPNPGCDFS
jgi:quercetin dioxygenase-like cupin family protein